MCAAGALAALVALSGCTHANAARGGGEKLGLCDVYKAYDKVPEPSPASTSEVRAYAQTVIRLMDRVDFQARVDGADVPAAVRGDVDAIKKGMHDFDRQFASAGTSAVAQRAAESALTTNAALDNAGRRLTAFFQDHCRDKGLSTAPLNGP